MRAKIQIRNEAGIFHDVLIDPSARNMLALDFLPSDLDFIERRQKANGSKERLHIGLMPFRLKTMVTGPNGKPMDIVVRRSALDWFCIELTPDDIRRLTQIRPGPTSRLITYAGPPGKDIVTQERINKFKDEWPELTNDDDNPPIEELGGVPMTMALDEKTAQAFRLWSQDWPPQYHATHRAPEAKLILPSGIVKEGG